MSNILVNMNGRLISHRKHSSRHMLVGGAVPVLLNKIVKRPASVGGSIGSNRIIGIKSPAPIINSTVVGGELLNSISFGRNVKNNNRDNIKFLF